MPGTSLDGLRVYGPTHATYLAEVVARIRQHYGPRLTALAVFGSYARGANRLDSDLDLLVVLADAPRRRERLEDFVLHVELPLTPLAVRLQVDEGISAELSPYLLTEEEAGFFQPIYVDLAEHHVVLADPRGFLADLLARLHAFLEAHPPERFRAGSGWGWDHGGYFGGCRL